jgi:hypothetical protein
MPLSEAEKGQFESSRRGGASAIRICIITIAAKNGNSRRISQKWYSNEENLRVDRHGAAVQGGADAIHTTRRLY